MTTPAIIPIVITPEMIREHGLTPEEFEKIKQLLGGREPTRTELGIFSVMWSEHCSYKSSRVHLKRLPTRSKLVLQGPGENAGIVDIGDGWACAFKIESHNHPSFIEPFQGAATGVGGILRDIFTMGARPVAMMDSLRFGPIREPVGTAALGRPTEQTASAEIHKNHSVMEGVVCGVASYGNCFGVPNLGGEVKFEPCYSGNPLVNAFALGLVRRDQIFYAKASGEGNPVIYVGSKTGRDGIHGATMASEEFSEGLRSEAPQRSSRRSVPRKTAARSLPRSHANRRDRWHSGHGRGRADLLDLRDGRARRRRIEIELDRVPQRETGMTPYEIMLSESQERMLLVAQKGREARSLPRLREMGARRSRNRHASPPTRKCACWNTAKWWRKFRMHALTDDAPVVQTSAGALGTARRPRECPSTSASAKARISRLNLSGCSPVRTSVRSVGCGSNTITWCRPTRSKRREQAMRASFASRVRKRGLAMALDGNGRWCYLDPRLGAMHAVAEAARKVACAGATPIGATNCLNFGNPEKPHIMWQFSQTIDGITKACEELDTPITGGNVSFYNETLSEGIYPTPVIGVVGILEDVHKTAKMHFAQSGRKIVLLRANEAGDAVDAEAEFGSSEYAKEILGAVWGYPPALDLEREATLQNALWSALIRAGLVESAHDCADGGLAVALVESALPAGVGLSVRLPGSTLPLEFALFAEDASRVVISCDPIQLPRIQQVAEEYGVSADVLGETGSDRVEIAVGDQSVISASVSELREAYEGALERALQTDPSVAAD